MLYDSFEEDSNLVLESYEALTEEIDDDSIEKVNQIKSKLADLKNFEKTSIFTRKAKIINSPNKVWTLTLKNKVKNSIATRKKVTLYNQFGEKVACTVPINGNKIKVKLKKAYVENTLYVIHIPRMITKTNGKCCNKNTYEKFVYE